MKKPFYISKETWESLSHKEQDFIFLLREKKYTKTQIMRKLYIESNMWFYKIRNRVRRKIENDVNLVYIVEK